MITKHKATRILNEVMNHFPEAKKEVVLGNIIYAITEDCDTKLFTPPHHNLQHKMNYDGTISFHVFKSKKDEGKRFSLRISDFRDMLEIKGYEALIEWHSFEGKSDNLNWAFGGRKDWRTDSKVLKAKDFKLIEDDEWTDAWRPK